MGKCFKDEMVRMKQNFARVRPMLQKMVDDPTTVTIEELTDFISENRLFFCDVSLHDCGNWTRREKELYFFFRFNYAPVVLALYLGDDVDKIMTSSEEEKQRDLFVQNILEIEKLILKLMKACNLLTEYNPAK